MTNAMKVNPEGSSTDAVLARIHESMPDVFHPHQWKMVSIAGVASSDEYDADIRYTMREKVITMFVPTPDKQMTYSVYKLENGNPFQTLEAMEFVTAEIPFEQARGVISLNLTGGGRDVVVLFPNPRSETVDLYIIRQPKKSEIINPIDHAKNGVDLILNHLVDPTDHDWTGHSSTLIMSNQLPKKGLDQTIDNILDSSSGKPALTSTDLIIKKPKDTSLIIKKPKDPRGFTLDKKLVPKLTDAFKQIDTGAISGHTLDESPTKPNPPKIYFTSDPDKIPAWMRETFRDTDMPIIEIPLTEIPKNKEMMYPKIEKNVKK